MQVFIAKHKNCSNIIIEYVMMIVEQCYTYQNVRVGKGFGQLNSNVGFGSGLLAKITATICFFYKFPGYTWAFT